jgi:hypothetical protein
VRGVCGRKLGGQSLTLGDEVGLATTERDLVTSELLEPRLSQAQADLRAAPVFRGTITRRSRLAGGRGGRVAFGA